MKYTAIFEKTETGYSAYVPDLPGCIAAGFSYEETKELIQGAIDIYIEELKAQGAAIPQPTTLAEQITAA